MSVTGAHSPSYDASATGTLSTDLIDRSGFDEAFGTSTTWTMDGSASKAPASTSAGSPTTGTGTVTTATTATSSNPFEAFVSWLKGLFGL